MTTRLSRNEVGNIVQVRVNKQTVLGLLLYKNDSLLIQRGKISDEPQNHRLKNHEQKGFKSCILMLKNHRAVTSIFFLKKKIKQFTLNFDFLLFIFYRQMRKKSCQKSVTKKKKTEQNRSYKNYFIPQPQPEPNIQHFNHQFLHVPDSHSQAQQKEEKFQFIGNKTKHLNQYFFSKRDFCLHSQVLDHDFMVASLQECDSQLRQNESRQSVNIKLEKMNSSELISNENPEDNVQPKTQSSKNKETNEMLSNMQRLSFNALFKNKRNTTKQPKVDDYHKNIPLTIVRKARDYFQQDKIMIKIIKLKCQKKMVQLSRFKELMDELKDVIRKSRQISLTKLYYQFLEPEDPVKQIFGWYFKQFVQNRYIHYLLDDSKIKDKAKYIDYVHRYLVNLGQHRSRYKVARSI